MYSLSLPFVTKSGLGRKGQIIFCSTDPSNPALNKPHISNYPRLWYHFHEK